jgi:hypothetical protein
LVVFALQLDTRDEINGNDRVADGDDFYREAGPTAFFGHVDVEPEHTFRDGAPDSQYEGQDPWVIDVGTA